MAESPDDFGRPTLEVSDFGSSSASIEEVVKPSADAQCSEEHVDEVVDASPMSITLEDGQGECNSCDKTFEDISCHPVLVLIAQSPNTSD